LQQRHHQGLFGSAAHPVKLIVPNPRKGILVLMNSLAGSLGFKGPGFNMGASLEAH